jgi:quercetin dioxygenase-like cupin family protein
LSLLAAVRIALAVQSWNLLEIETPEGSRSPVVLHSEDGQSRAVLIALDPGQELGDHQVKEAALLVVAEGSVHVAAGGDRVEASTGTVFRFEPNERHAVSTDSGARLLLVLAPWPGEGHYRGDELSSD